MNKKEFYVVITDYIYKSLNMEADECVEETRPIWFNTYEEAVEFTKNNIVHKFMKCDSDGKVLKYYNVDEVYKNVNV